MHEDYATRLYLKVRDFLHLHAGILAEGQHICWWPTSSFQHTTLLSSSDYILLWLPLYLPRTSYYQVPYVLNGIWKLQSCERI